MHDFVCGFKVLDYWKGLTADGEELAERKELRLVALCIIST